ncbi:YheC/YheD family protein [Paenibacillus sepulcri]|uniref:YheC/YheD family protein n=1 Tax=Paenibacillus sepulcri TaxID=359917 RepID=A0ABS7CCD8_9BACL|nr:YheC/YheD family protein [Paenibacillus sepulcri]
MYRNGALLGIMVATRKIRKSSLINYLRHNTTHLNLFCFTPADIDWQRNRITGLHRSRGKWAISIFPFPKVIYNRCYELKQEMIEQLEAIIGRNKCFNHINHLNKYETHNHLTKSLVPYLPETLPFDRKNAVEMLAAHKLLYLKPCYGNKGKGVYRIELKDSGEIHIGEHYIQPSIIASNIPQFLESVQTLLGSETYIIQRGVPTQRLAGRIFDIRVLVQKNKTGIWSVTSVISRVAYKGCFNTSIFEKMCSSIEAFNYLYPQEQAGAILNRIHEISLQAAKTIETGSGLHLGELSVDLALDNDCHPWIIEVNGKPQKSLYQAFRNKSTVYKRPLEYAHFLQNR